MPDGDSSILRPEHPLARPLTALVDDFGLDSRGALDGIELTGITLDSRNVLPGDLFVGLRGARAHGASRAMEAASRGAVAVLTDEEGAVLAAESGLPLVIVESPREALGAVSAWVYRTDEAPPLMLAVTGTNGKTSVSYFLYGILGQLGLVAGLSTTAQRVIGTTAITSELTTPEATEIHGFLARLRENNVRAVALEVSAQALSRHRVDGLVFDVAGFLNLSRDHLDDYDDSMETYFEAKLPLFSPDRARRAVVSLDTPWGARVVDSCHIPVTTITSHDTEAADWHVRILEETIAGTRFALEGPTGRTITTWVPVVGAHMAANAAFAIVMLTEAGFDLDAIGHVLDRDGGITATVPGRLERVSRDGAPALIVDYGHTPDAFAVTLDALRRVVSGRIIMVFGADGDRDSGKRADMGRIAAEGADVLVITDYNPRFEDPVPIRTALLAGARTAHNPAEIHEVPSQREAIRFAVARAGDEDAILWAGPGHEDYIDVQGKKLPFNAREEARAALREAGWA